MSGLLAWEDARERVLSQVKPLPPLDLATRDALGLAAAEHVTSPEAMPPFANSAVDGFAVRADDILHASRTTPTRLRVVANRPAGHTSAVRLEQGQAIRIMTGAPIPDGADTVVMLEDTDSWDEAARRSRPPETEVAVHRPAEPGEHIRPKGESVQPGDSLLMPGDLIRAPEIGLLLSVGVRSVRVHPMPRVAVFSSGDEIVPAESNPGPGMIRDSNRPAILSALMRRRFPVIDLGLFPDQEERLVEAVGRGVREADFVIGSGGVSVGDRDLTHRVLSRLGSAQALRVAMKPGKPQVFGEVEGVPVYGLPGNPVSALVVFDLFVLPALRKMSGWTDVHRPLFIARLSRPIERRGGRTEFVRVRLETDHGSWTARSTGPQGSGILTSMTRANGYAILPADVENLDVGAGVLCMLWED